MKHQGIEIERYDAQTSLCTRVRITLRERDCGRWAAWGAYDRSPCPSPTSPPRCQGESVRTRRGESAREHDRRSGRRDVRGTLAGPEPVTASGGRAAEALGAHPASDGDLMSGVPQPPAPNLSPEEFLTAVAFEYGADSFARPTRGRAREAAAGADNDALLNERPISARVEPAPRPEPAPTRCKPSCGCGHNETCACHRPEGTQT